MRTKSILTCAITCLLASACGGDYIDQEQTSSNNRIINGWRANNWQYPSTVALITTWNDSIHCTGTMVRPDAVLTAAHCVEGMPLSSMMVMYDGNKDSGPSFFEIYSMISHPEGNPNHTGCDPSGLEKCTISDERPWNDVALVVLKDPIPNSMCVPILPKERFDEFLNVGATVRIAGYGINWVEDTGPLYAADVPVIIRTSSEVEVGKDEKGASGACFGDSGGPIYVTVDDHVSVTGITSRSAWKAECGHGAIYELPGWYTEWFELTYVKNVCQRNLEEDDDIGAYDECINGTVSFTEKAECSFTGMLPASEPPTTKPQSDSGTIKVPSTDGGKQLPKPSDAGSVSEHDTEDSACGCNFANQNRNLNFFLLFSALCALLIRRR